MAALVIIGPVAGLTGFFFLSDLPTILGAIMLFASGGIVYLIFQDVAPPGAPTAALGASPGGSSGFFRGTLQ